ncbi:hypothetical protein VP01_64g9, partial [Puccinia sorghi]
CQGKLLRTTSSSMDTGFHHDSKLAGHPGCTKTLSLVQHLFSWPSIKNHITFSAHLVLHCTVPLVGKRW